MPKEEGAGQLRFCRDCGAKIRPGNEFCTSCGAPLTPETKASKNTHAEFAPEGEPEEEERAGDEKRSPQEADPRKSPREIYQEYGLYKRFFEEAREGLVRFTALLKETADEPDRGDPLGHNDLALALLHAQKGLNKSEEYGGDVNKPLPGQFASGEGYSHVGRVKERSG